MVKKMTRSKGKKEARTNWIVGVFSKKGCFSSLCIIMRNYRTDYKEIQICQISLLGQKSLPTPRLAWTQDIVSEAK